MDTSPAARRVLVVDDDPDSAYVLSVLLGLDGHDVRVAHDGAEALEVAAAFVPEVAILDLGLPKIDGFEVARRLREHAGRTMTLIALTGRAEPEDIASGREAGFDDYVVKPITDSDAFRETVKAAGRA